MDENALKGIELVRGFTKEILAFAEHHQGERLLVTFYEESLNSIETFSEGRNRLDVEESPLMIPFDSLVQGMDTAAEASSENAVILTFIAMYPSGEEEYEVSTGVMSCERRFLSEGQEAPEKIPQVNTLTRGKA